MKDQILASKGILIVFVIAFSGAQLFRLLTLPVPWLLGPLFAMVIFQFLYKGALHWPVQFRDVGLIVSGLAIGQQFDLALFNQLGILLLYMFLLNIGVVIGAIGIAFLLSKWLKLSLKTMILSTLPGGIAQIVTFAEEEKDIDVPVVTYFHVIRILLVVLLVPFIVASEAVQKPVITEPITIGLLVMIIFAWGCAILAKKIRFPTATFIVPILLMILFNFGSMNVPTVPTILMNLAQLCVGTHIGLGIKPHMLKLPFRQVMAGLLSSLGLLGLTYGTTYLLMVFLDYSFATGFLSTAPGGLDQMVLLAEAIGADVSAVTVFQIFRLLFLFLITIPILRFFYAKIAPYKIVSHHTDV